jgi:hypothetical protein
MAIKGVQRVCVRHNIACLLHVLRNLILYTALGSAIPAALVRGPGVAAPGVLGPDEVRVVGDAAGLK